MEITTSRTLGNCLAVSLICERMAATRQEPPAPNSSVPPKSTNIYPIKNSAPIALWTRLCAGFFILFNRRINLSLLLQILASRSMNNKVECVSSKRKDCYSNQQANDDAIGAECYDAADLGQEGL